MKPAPMRFLGPARALSLLALAISLLLQATLLQAAPRGRGGGPRYIGRFISEEERRDNMLRIAARQGRLDMLENAIKIGARVDSRSARKRTALMFAAQQCSLPIVKRLVGVGADINLRDDVGRGPLMYAVRESCLDVVEYLLKRPGIKTNRRDAQGRTPAEYAKRAALLDVGGPASKILQLFEARSVKAR